MQLLYNYKDSIVWEARMDDRYCLTTLADTQANMTADKFIKNCIKMFKQEHHREPRKLEVWVNKDA